MTTLRSRSPRVESKPGRFNCVVRYQNSATGDPLVAQFADISESGMRLISRQLSHAKVDDLLRLEFTLPGTKRSLALQSRVVRQINDFTFAVRFAGLDPGEKAELAMAIAEYVDYAKPSAWRDLQHELAGWLQLHWRGVTISLVGIVFAVFANGIVYSNSDEHKGRELRSWGYYPKKWSFDYWSKDSYNGSSTAPVSSTPLPTPTPIY